MIHTKYREADMKKYIQDIRMNLAFFRIRFFIGLQYRSAALAGVITQFAWGFMQIMIYKAFYEADAGAFPISLSATVSYMWLQQAFLAFFATWMMENEMFDSVVNGNIAYEMCRPISIYNMWFSRSVANRVSRAVLRCLPILIVAAFLPEPYKLAPPASFGCLIVFILTLLLGLLVTVAFCMIIYGLTFFTISPQGLRIVFTSMVEFFAGGIIPLPFFPEKIKWIIELLPFASMQNTALQVYSKSLSAEQIKRAVVLQVFWLIVLVLQGKLLCRYAERKVMVQGG